MMEETLVLYYTVGQSLISFIKFTMLLLIIDYNVISSLSLNFAFLAQNCVQIVTVNLTFKLLNVVILNELKMIKYANIVCQFSIPYS